MSIRQRFLHTSKLPSSIIQEYILATLPIQSVGETVSHVLDNPKFVYFWVANMIIQRYIEGWMRMYPYAHMFACLIASLYNCLGNIRVLEGSVFLGMGFEVSNPKCVPSRSFTLPFSLPPLSLLHED